MSQAPIHDGLAGDTFKVVTREDVSDSNTEFVGRRLDSFMQEIRTTLDLHRVDIAAIGAKVTEAIGDLPARVAYVEGSVHRHDDLHDQHGVEIAKVKRRVARLEKVPKRKPRKKAKRK